MVVITPFADPKNDPNRDSKTVIKYRISIRI